ncbi:MAG: DUF4279 domain-containing protein [Hyphomicrobiaceae bacterium]
MTFGSTPSQPPAGHIYTVEIRFYGDNLDPSEISRRIGLLPSVSHLTVGPLSRPMRPFWGYNGHDADGFLPEWRALEDGLRVLVRRLAAKRSTVAELSQAYDGVWWCGHFQSAFDGGPRLSPETLAEIAAYGLPLYIDNYHSDEG